MANINVLVGTVTGKALNAAQAIAEVFEPLHCVQVCLNPTIDNVTNEHVDILVIVTSSTGQGNLPPAMLALYEQLQAASPLIPTKRFAVVGLGDSSFLTYCQASATMEQLMLELQGQTLCPRFNIDALEHYMPAAIARQWAEETIQLIT